MLAPIIHFLSLNTTITQSVFIKKNMISNYNQTLLIN